MTQFTATEAQHLGMQQTLEASRQKMTGLQTEMASIQSQIDVTVQTLTALTTEKTALETEVAKTKEAQPLLSESMTKALEAALRLPENADLKKAADGVSEQVKQLEVKIATLDPQIVDRSAKIMAANESMKLMTDTMAIKQTELAIVTQEVQKMDTDILPVRQQFDLLSQQIAGMRDLVMQSQSQVARWQGEIAFVSRLNDLNQQLAASQLVITERQTAVGAAAAVVDQAQGSLNMAQASVQQAQAKADEIRRQINEARQPSSPVTVPNPPQ